jgi:hypothetical protein
MGFSMSQLREHYRFGDPSDFDQNESKRMTDRISQAVEQILARTGIGKQIADEAEANRVAQHAGLRKRKAAALARFLKDKPGAESGIAAADAQARAAQKAAEDAFRTYLKAREALDTVYGTLTVVVDPIDLEMKQCYDPRIDSFMAELEELRAATPGLHRTWPDSKGPFTDTNGNRLSDNRVAIESRIRAIGEIRDAAERLKIHEGVEDVPAELDRLRKSIPEA